ncbi:MAG TPA: hypothetical protein VMA97_09650 [Streptosporangiaceae bacterium]|nr:hypothetical protein [Streptosporangiaceae bacterium]
MLKHRMARGSPRPGGRLLSIKDGDAKVAGIAIEVPGDADVTGGSHAFRLELCEAVITSVEGDELVVRFWRPGLGVRAVRRR